ncbi:MAG: hypothetical protein ACOC7T_01050 [Planctomycetota bacterium]
MATPEREEQTVEVYGREFHPLVTYLGGPFGRQAFDVAAEVTFVHDHFDDRARDGGLGLLVDRHVDPDVALPRGNFVERDTPAEDVRRDGPYLSLAVRPPVRGANPEGGELYDPDAGEPPHAREWDFLREHARKALDEAGVAEDADDVDRVHAFAEYAQQFKKSPTYASFHPVDVLLHSSYCTGAANVLAALADVSGIPVRHACISNHTMTELFFGGRWQFADNHAGGARLVPWADYVDVTLNPGEFEQFSEKQRSYLGHRRTWARSPWHYSGMLRWHWAWGAGSDRGIRTSVMDGYGVGVPCDPRHAAALYPERDRYPFPVRGDTPALTLTEKASWLRVDLLLGPGEAVLKSFRVTDCADNPVREAWVDWWFRGDVTLQDVEVQFADGHSIRPADALPGSDGVSRLRCELPVEVVAEPGRHRLALVNGSTETLHPVAFPTPVVNPPAVATEGALQVYPQSLTREPVLV